MPRCSTLYLRNTAMSSFETSSTVQEIRDAGIMAVIRAPSASAAVETARALLAGGVRGIEITFSTPGACDAIAEVGRLASAGALPARPVIGAGTVLTTVQAEQAIKAGAVFLVSPCLIPEVVQAAKLGGVAALPGAFTPTEIYQAHQAGADIVKVFPAARLGPAYFKDLRGPLPHIPLMPTGGVEASNVAEWMEAGAVALGAGSNLIPGSAVKEEDWGEITKLAREMAEALDEWREYRKK